MDKYESIHGKDISSFDFTSTHRLPTVSAAEAFDSLETDFQQFVPTGLDGLDQALAGASPGDGSESRGPGGIRKGQIVEVWGPPASGKTTFAMQIASHTLRDGQGVVWVDAFHSLCWHRLGQIVNSFGSTPRGTTTYPSLPEGISNFTHYNTPTLAHLIALLCKPGRSSIPASTSLIVIDGLSGLINRAFPKNTAPQQPSKGASPATRRFQVLQFIISALQKLSATRDILIVVLSQCVTKMQAERGAALTPAITASNWEQGIATRLVLFQDWTTMDGNLHNIRLLAVQKSNSQASTDGIGLVFPFDICNDGLIGLGSATDRVSLTLAANSSYRKRKFADTDFEIADSEGEDYGWENEDEAEMPNMPPQWQGSEDILLTPLNPLDEDDNVTSDIEDLSNSTSPVSRLDDEQ